MKNSLLAPEFRGYIANKQEDKLRDLCTNTHPAVVAIFMSALDPSEAWGCHCHRARPAGGDLDADRCLASHYGMRFKVDPAVVASPALTTVVDITGRLAEDRTAQPQ